MNQTLIRLFIAGLALGILIFSYHSFFTSSSLSPVNTNPKEFFDLSPLEAQANLSKVTFAGGCFWCMEAPFENLDGVEAAISGYSGGFVENPSYQEVVSGTTGHTEAIQIYYNASIINYNQLLDAFWKAHDPTDAGGQFADRGPQYRPVIFYRTEEEKQMAEVSKKQLDESGTFDKPVVTAIEAFTNFYPAEIYHQDYYLKSSLQYKLYEKGSGRADFLDKFWGIFKNTKLPSEEKISDKQKKNSEKITKLNFDEIAKRWSTFEKPNQKELQEQLTDIQYKVTQKNGTEAAFSNPYHDNKEEGIYVDIVSGEPLFSSTHKYDSGTGWPSFYTTIAPVVEKTDWKLIYPRTEVRSKYADSHLGHVFKDGPNPSGLRYCMNAAALKFIPKQDLADSKYKDYLPLFE